MRGTKGHFTRQLIEALEAAGYEFSRRASSHLVYKAPGRPTITLARANDDFKKAKQIAKIAGVSLCR